MNTYFYLSKLTLLYINNIFLKIMSNPINNRIKYVVMIAAVFCVFVSASQGDESSADWKKDLEIIKTNMRNALLTKVNDQKISSPDKDGFWPEINYKDQTRGAWRTFAHIANIRKLASNPARHDETIRALRAWQKLDPRNPNWWWQEIGVPSSVCDTMIMLGNDLPKDLLDSYRSVLDRSKPGMTGQNKVWVAEIHVKKGLLYNDPKMVRDGCEQILSELKTVTFGQEGIQDDFSFHQHGSQLQIGNYGLSFFSDSVRWAHLLKGTSFQLSKDQLNLLDHLFYDMTRLVMFKGFFDYSACARQIGFNAPIGKHSNAYWAAQSLMSLLPEDRQKLYRTAMPKKNLVFAEETKWFPRSAYLIHRPVSDWYFSVRMCTPQIIGSETVNSENASGKFQADGTTFLMSDTKEYSNIIFYWDWRHLPGTTEVQDNSSLTARGIRNKKGMAVGLTGDRCGLAAFHFSPDEITAKKIWFCFPRAIVCSGFNIASNTKNEVHTTIDQTAWLGEVLIKKKGKTYQAREGITDLTGAEAVIHHNVEYILSPDDQYQLKLSEEQGNIQTVNAAEPSKPVSGKIFLLTVNHGQTPKNESYFYIMKPNTNGNQEKITRLKTSSPMIQAVYSETTKIVMIAAWKPGKIQLSDGSEKIIKTPALILIQNNKEKFFPIPRKNTKTVKR